MAKSSRIIIEGTEITIIKEDDQDFISLTDMIKAKDGDFLFRTGSETEIQLNFLAFGN